MSAMRVFVVEDSPIVRERLLEMLSEIDGVDVVGDADNADDAIERILRLMPDVAVLDIKLKRGSGIGVLEQIHRQAPRVATIMLTNFAGAEHRQRCLDAGANYFFDKTEEFESVKDALQDLRAAGAPPAH
ncbi:MAG: response regulator transcription factor [Rhodocyclaceae bacterium]|nr:MAG: response regulator transcription factor [Rhodocyclaceae bacterium]